MTIHLESTKLTVDVPVDDPRVRALEELLTYEYIGMYGEPDPDPLGGLSGARVPYGSIILMEDAVRNLPIGVCGITVHDGIATLHRMFVRWQYRGMGIARSLLAAAELRAVAADAYALRLETGTQQTSAIALYTSHGYTACAPFGYYADAETSVFLAKEL